MHHIVPVEDGRAAPARAIMDEVDIEYNLAINSVVLPNKKNAANPYITAEASHIGNHSPNSIDQVNNRLIDSLRSGLLDGKLKSN